jgi:O-antigen/teichoic acid export membrane protein
MNHQNRTGTSDRTLFADGAVYAGVEVIQQTLGFISLPIFLFYLSTADFGAVTWGITASNLTTAIATLGLEFSVLRLYWKWAADDRERIAARACAVSLVWSLMSGAAMTAGVWVLAPIWLRAPLIWAIWAGAALGVRSIALSVFRVRGPLARYAPIVIAGSLLPVVAGFALVVAGWKATGYLAGYAVGAIVTALVAMRDLRPWSGGGFALPAELVTYTIHTFPANFINRTIAIADRLVLGTFGSIDALGLYGAAARLTTPVRFMSSIFRMALAPSLSKTEAHGDVAGTVGRLALTITALMLLVGTLVAIAGWFLRFTPWVASESTLQRLVMVLLMTEFLSALSSLGLLHLYYSDTPRRASIAAAVGGALVIALLLALIPRYGIFGAAGARLSAAAGGLIAVYLLAGRTAAIRHRTQLLPMLVSFVPLVVATYLLGAGAQLAVFGAMAALYAVITARVLAPIWRNPLPATVQ